MRARVAENAGRNLAALGFLCQALEPQDHLCLDPLLPLPNKGSPLEKPQRVERAEGGVTHLLLGQCPGAGVHLTSLNGHTVHISSIRLESLFDIR